MIKVTRILIMTFIIFLTNNITAIADDDFNINLDLSGIEQQLSDDNIDLNYDELIKQVKNGDFKHIADAFRTNSFKAFANNEVDNKKIMLRIFAICLISVIINMFADNRDYDLCDKILFCLILCLLLELYGQMYFKCLETINSMIDFIKVSIPIYFSVSMIVYDRLPLSAYSLFIIFIHIFQWLSVNLIFPLQTFSVLCTALDGIYKDFNFKRIKKQIVDFVRIILGIYTTFFILGLKITQTISYSSQKAVMTGVQLALSKFIPVIGGFLSETAQTLFASIVLIHNSVGISSVLAILMIVFGPFVSVFVVSLVIKIFCSILISFANNKLIETVYAFGECMCELSIILLCCSVTFIIGIATEFISVR